MAEFEYRLTISAESKEEADQKAAFLAEFRGVTRMRPSSEPHSIEPNTIDFTIKTEKLKDLIKTKRMLLGMSQTELAELVKIPQTTISRLEGGRQFSTSKDRFERIAKALGITSTELILSTSNKVIVTSRDRSDIGDVDFSISLGDVIKRWRGYKGLTQTQLATISGIDRTTINRMEHNKADSTRDLTSLAHALNISTGQLLLRVMPESSEPNMTKEG